MARLNSDSNIEKTLAAPASTDPEIGKITAPLPERNELVLEDQEFVPPDGGWLAWSQVLATLLTCTISWGLPSAFGVYQLYYRDTLKLPQSQVSWIGSVQFLLTYGICTCSGRLADAGYIRSTMALGSFLVVFGTFMTSLGTEYWHFFVAQGVCVGIGLGIMFMPPLSVTSSYFLKNRTMALTCAATGTSIGSVIFPAIIQYLIPQVGFGWAVRVSGFVALFCMVTAIILIRPQLQPRTSGPIVEWAAFKEVPYLLYSVGAFLLYWALFFGSFYINSFARNIIGFSTIDSVQLLLILNGVSIPARPLAGYIANWHFGVMNTYIIATIFFGIVTLAWMAVHDRAGMYVIAVFFGLGNGVCQGLFLGSLASLTSDATKMGTRIGMVHTLVAFATLAGPPTAGAIIDSSDGRYTYAQIWAGSLILVAAGLFIGARTAVVGKVVRVRI
ncbi:MFS general substrate transporter [Coniochaeta ligniaria NRRL 30616]|uniref:MFS general substrate transporter n=1 Tax=Coniochaeta ligniaria NRRL 30616 TaxID=1408157 RepID=A0A1J7IYG2_9PEZI|nr:MFS general substrate transporter [Coniochaeta ligniaria NRRL 30616]